MAYRGEDLDLRTPQGWSSSSRETVGEQPNWWTRTAVYKGGRADPLWVDDNVMACCNHAYDLAVAHRAPEVRLEHLINALTMSEPAAQILEARGLSILSLRRESGSTIANDIPAAANGHTVPKRSEALEETLRLAADRAYPRRTPVTVEDLLHVLFDMRRDLPGAQLLHRHTGTSPRNGADLRSELRPDLRLEPLPHLARPYADPRYAPPPMATPPAPRYGSPAAHDYFSQPTREPAPPMREPVRETYRETARVMREPRPPANQVDSLQNNRIDSLERAVRDLGIDLADERKTVQSLLGDLQRTALSQSDDSGRFHGGLNDRLAALEDTFVRSLNESASLPAAVMDRLGIMERNIEVRMAESGRGQAIPQALFERLEARLADVGRISMQTNERLHAIEQTSNRPVEATLSPLVSQRLDNITAFGSKIDALERTFQVILDRLTGLERKLALAPDSKSLDLTPMHARLGDIERNVLMVVKQGSDMSPVTDLLSGIEERVVGLERTLENRSAETGRTVSFIGDRLRGFEDAITGQRSQTAERLVQLERSLTAYAENTLTNDGGHERELTEVHEALLKLNANQQTLALSLDQWRLDSTGDLSVISNRLKTIEDADQRQDPRIDALGAQIGTIHASIAKREVRKSRFLHWLFGTDEWYSASFDTKNWRARQSEPMPAEIRMVQRPTPPAPPPSAIRR